MSLWWRKRGWKRGGVKVNRTPLKHTGKVGLRRANEAFYDALLAYIKGKSNA
jgi:hypothetical protein